MDCGKSTVDEIIQSLPPAEAVIVRRLRALITESLPKAEERNSYGVPFYRHHRMICFIWPPSIQWGSEKKKKEDRGVTLGFCQGNLFANEDGCLLKEGRSQVYCMYFKKLSDIDDAQIRTLLYEAELIDESFGVKKKKKIRR